VRSVSEQKTCNIYETVRDRSMLLLWPTNRSRIRAFDWCQNQWPRMNLNDQNPVLRKKNGFTEPLFLPCRLEILET